MVAMLTVISKKMGKLPFTNGNGRSAAIKQNATDHLQINEKIDKLAGIMTEFSTGHIQMASTIEVHAVQLKDGKEKFEKVQESIHSIDVSLAVLASEVGRK